MNTFQDHFDKIYNPIYQALIILVVVFLFMAVAALIGKTGLLEVEARFPWLVAASFILFFAMFNSVLSLSTKDMMKYWGRSIYSYLGLAAASGLLAYLFSSLPISEAGSYRWIYVVLTFGYLVFLSMMAFMKNIVDFAQKEEWNHPRIRNKRRK